MSIYSRNEPRQHFKPVEKSLLHKRNPVILKIFYHHLKRQAEEVETTTPPDAS